MGAFTDVLVGVGETPFGGGKSGDSTIIGGGKSGESTTIGGIEATTPGGGKSGESTIIRPLGRAKDGESIITDGGGLNEEESMTTGGRVFDGVRVLSRTIPEAVANSRTVDVVDCEGPGGLRETRVGGKISATDGISPGGSFGDDLSTTVNGVSGIGDSKGERAC